MPSWRAIEKPSFPDSLIDIAETACVPRHPRANHPYWPKRLRECVIVCPPIFDLWNIDSTPGDIRRIGTSNQIGSAVYRPHIFHHDTFSSIHPRSGRP
jgi:hypothetical protein